MRRNIQAIIALVLTVALLCAGCAGSGSKASPKNISELPEYEELSALIGCTLEEAIEKMGWQADQVVEDVESYYKTPLNVEYAGVLFQVLLAINPFEKKVNTIVYHAEYENAEETAAKEILQVAKKLGGAIGRKTEAQNELMDLAVFEMTEAQLQEILGDKRLEKEFRWNLNEAADTVQKDYMNMLKDTESWEIYGERQPQYCLEMAITHIEDTVYMRLNLGVKPELLK